MSLLLIGKSSTLSIPSQHCYRLKIAAYMLANAHVQPLRFIQNLYFN